MRIRYKVALVGGIPITIAAGIALIAWLLLSEAERARSGAVLAGAAYRDLTSVMRARDDFIAAREAGREQHARRFAEAAERAQSRLQGLADIARDPGHRAATTDTEAALDGYREQMERLRAVTERNDRLIGEMNARAAALISLTDAARERQHASNADIIASLAEGDRKLRFARDVVDRAQELRAAAAALELRRLETASGREDRAAAERDVRFGMARLRNAARDLAQLLRQDGRAAAADELATLLPGDTGSDGPPSGAAPAAPAQDEQANSRLADWIDRLIKVTATEQRALHDELAQLLTYSVQAAETEQATQNIAIATLKLGRRALDALSGRDAEATDAIVAESRALEATMASLPISPLIQSEMIDAIAGWREGLATTGHGLRLQNGILAAMDATAATMIAGAGALNDLFTDDAERIGQFVRTILILGAALGLLLGSGTAFLAARSITRPLKDLQDRMIDLAADPAAGLVPDSNRRDELGAMARAANFFVTEIGRREAALRQAKERADATLIELKEAQANLIQAEKLASLGQLVAGVAHEINTPLGIALTTSTTLDREIQRLSEAAATGRLLKSELTRVIDRLNEGCRLLFANLTRAVDLVHSFKQVAADRASGERRRFDVKGWVHELLTSLGPVLRKSGHAVAVECPDGLVIDSYPGALAQVLTNLVMNSVAHAFPDGRSGHLTLRVREPQRGLVRFVYADDGSGIPPDHLGRVFDPFFTTGRDRGSTGLGLHLVYNLVTVTLHGRIEIDSKPGAGTRFTIDVPVSVGEAAPAPLALLA